MSRFFLPWTADTGSTIGVLHILYFVSDTESESEPESESIRSLELESESEQHHLDPSPLSTFPGDDKIWHFLTSEDLSIVLSERKVTETLQMYSVTAIEHFLCLFLSFLVIHLLF